MCYNNFFSYSVKNEQYLHLDEEFTLESGESPSNKFVLTVTTKPNHYFLNTSDSNTEAFSGVYNSLTEVKQAMNDYALSRWLSHNKVIGFQVETIGRSLTENEYESVNKHKLKLIQMRDKIIKRKREGKIQALEKQLKQLKNNWEELYYEIH